MRLHVIIFGILIFSGVALAESSDDYGHSEREMQSAFENCDIHARKKLCQSICRSALNEINRAKTQGGVPNAAKLKQCREYNIAGNRKIAPNPKGYDYTGLIEEMEGLKKQCEKRADARRCGVICSYAVRDLRSAETKGLDPGGIKGVERCRGFFNGTSDIPAKKESSSTTPKTPATSNVSAEVMGEKAKYCESELATLISNAKPENFERIGKLQQCYGYCAGAAQYIAAGLKNLEKSIKLCDDAYSQVRP